MVTVTSPLGAICTKADGCSVGLRALVACSAPAPCAVARCGKAPSAKPPTPASFRNLRRGSVAIGSGRSRSNISCRARGMSPWSRLGDMAAPSGEGLGGIGHRGADAGVGATAADVAGHGRVDLGGAGLLAARQRLEERGRAHDLAALA